MSTIKLPAASGGGSISLKGPSSAGSDTDFLDTSGNLKVTGNTGVGVTASEKLHVDKGAPGGGNAVIARFQAESSRRLDVVWHDSGSLMGFDTPSDHGYIFKTNGTERLRIKDDGTIQTNGALDIKIADGNLVMGTAGHGIDFSATSDGSGTDSSELLDDYEEGTFVPTLGGSNISTYSVNGAGKYTRIGRMVHVEWRFENVDLSNSSVNQVRIHGWPYAFNLTTTRPQCGSLMMNNVVLTHSHDENTYFFYAETTTELRGLISRDATGWSSWDVTDFQSSGLYLDGTF